MSRGTILIIGPSNREIELLSSRLEGENYTLVLAQNTQVVSRSLQEGTVQVIFISPLVSRKLAQRVIDAKENLKRTRHLPVIQLVDSDVPVDLTKIRGIGETFRLHAISLKEAVNRMRRAVALCQLVRL